MEIRCCSFQNMAADIKSRNQRILLFGAGVIGTVTTPEILAEYHLLSYVECYIDNDEKKCGSLIKTGEKSVPVSSMRYIKNLTENNKVILLNIIRYAEVLARLEAMRQTEHMICYIMPVMCIYNFYNRRPYGVFHDSATPLIPRTIHYFWLGGKEIPNNLQKCIDSWKRYCPDYEIIRWDEKNYDVNKVKYTRQAYEKKAYGFVPDYARLDILYQYGGIYMDTDVELLRPLDELLCQEAFCGVEKWQVINFGGCSGAVRHHKVLREILDYRKNIPFVDDNGEDNKNTCGFYDTKIMLAHGYKMSGMPQKIDGINIYTYDYFHPYDYMSGRMDISLNTFSVHHFNGGWLNEEMKELNIKTMEEFREICGRMIFDDEKKKLWMQRTGQEKYAKRRTTD